MPKTSGGGGGTLTYLLAGLFALATGGAWAVSTTYRQSLGAAEGANILFEGVLTVNDEITHTAKLAFPGITLDDIPTRASFFSSSFGIHISNKYATCVGMHETRHYDSDGKCDKLALQCGVHEGGFTKCVLILLTNGASGDGVYVQKVATYYVSGSYMFCKYYTMDSNGNISKTGNPTGWSTTDNNYQLAGLRVCGASPTAAGKADVVAFPGKTLADIKDCNFIAAFRAGRSYSRTAANNVGINITPWPSSEAPKKIVMQFTHPDDDKKTAVIQLTNGVNGVYAFQSHHTWYGDENLNYKRFVIDSTTGAVSANNTNKGTTSNDPPEYQVHGLCVLPPCIKRTPNKIKVFDDKTLNDIKDGVFTARMCGAYMDKSYREIFDSAVGYNKKVYEDEYGSVTNIIVEFQARDGSSTKCLIVQFENGEGGVYASAINARYSSEAIGKTFRDYDGTLHGTEMTKFAEMVTANGYGVFDLRVAVEEATEWTLSQNKTWSELRNGAVLSSEEVVRIKVTGDSPVLTIDENVNVAKIEFVNALGSGISTNTIAVSDGAALTYGTLALGQYACVKIHGSIAPSVAEILPGATLLYASGEAESASYSGAGAIEVASGAKLIVNKDVNVAYILNHGTVEKHGAGAVLVPFHNASKGVTIISEGTLKVSGATQVTDNPYAYYTEENPNANQFIDVKSGATYDVNGFGNVTAVVRLEEGARIVNSNANVSCYLAQTFQLILNGDATAIATGNFGMIAPGYKESLLQLGNYKLTVQGSKALYLCNTTISGTGTIVVETELWFYHTDTKGLECTVDVKSNGKVNFEASLLVKNFVNGGTISGNGILVVYGELTAGSAAIPKLKFRDGAILKASATTAQTVSSSFIAEGAVTIDASQITREQFKQDEDGRIPVLTIPAASYNDTFKAWQISGEGSSMLRLRWEADEGDATRTLYLSRSGGTRIVIR